MDSEEELFEWGRGERIAQEILQKFIESGIRSLSDIARCDIELLLRNYGSSFNKLQAKRFHTSINVLREKMYPADRGSNNSSKSSISSICSASSPRGNGEAAMDIVSVKEEIPADNFDDDMDDSSCKGALELAEKSASMECLKAQFDQENEVLNLLNDLILGNDFDDNDVWGKCIQFRKNAKERLKLYKNSHQVRAKRLLDLLESASSMNVSNSKIEGSPKPPPSRSSSIRSAKSGPPIKPCLKRALSGENRRVLKIKYDGQVSIFHYHEEHLDLVNKTFVALATAEKHKSSTSVSKREGFELIQIFNNYPVK